LLRYAAQNQFRRHIGVTYVAVDGGTILGFATVTVGHIEIENLPQSLRKKFPGYPLPVLRLARLGVDRADLAKYGPPFVNRHRGSRQSDGQPFFHLIPRGS